MAHHGGVARPVGQLDGVQGLGEGADLVELDEHAVAHAQLDSLADAAHVGDEEVVAHQLHLLAQLFGEHLPALPVVLGHAVFDGDDGVFLNETGVHFHHLFGGHGDAPLGQMIASVLLAEPVGDRAVDGQHEVLAGLVTRLLDGGDQGLQGVFVAVQVGGVAALVAHAGGGDHLLEGVEHLGAHPQGFLPALGAHGHDHEFLDVHVGAGGVGAAVEDVHHGHGQGLGIGAADIAVQRHAKGVGRGLGAGQGDAQQGVGAQAGLVGGAVQLLEQAVDGHLVHGVQADEGFRDLAVDGGYGVFHALAQIAALVAVPQLAGLVNAGGSAGGHGGPAHSAVVQPDLRLHGGVAPAVQDLPADDVDDLQIFAHVRILLIILLS